MKKRGYRSLLPYRKEAIDGQLTRKDARFAKVESSESYLVRDGIKFTINEMARAADVGVKRALLPALRCSCQYVLKKASRSYLWY